MNHYLYDRFRKADFLLERSVSIHRHKNLDYLSLPFLLDAYT